MDGFTISGGYDYDMGGGILCLESSPIIKNCKIINNSIDNIGAEGGGIWCSGNPVIINCIISFNGVFGGEMEEPGGKAKGGGICCYGSPTIINCLITNNYVGGGAYMIDGPGGGIYCADGELNIRNCTFSGNIAWSGQAIYNDNGDIVITDSIIWGNFDQPLLIQDQIRNYGSLVISYSNIQEGWPGVENINADPLFFDSQNYDYHLSSIIWFAVY